MTKKKYVTLDFFKTFCLPKTYDENMFKADGSINPKYNSFKKTGIIAQIFEDYWDIVYSKYGDAIDKYRPNANKEIKKNYWLQK